ncbi:M23 family metallopeptidase [Staphylococcus lutrae]|uniref:lysostaphin n=1 Tax=Staphylococcus lutrae TaxID=155085 RepID=A0AAC9RTQ9_9STAP|nr:M23 family metallopeptidase [Staphylococcus lutrae]ARJ50615.1 peptidase M23 [Staphylococcus lutrae]PNZ38802.1 M23 family peptidase [Staphylococcus lutrae]
MKPLIRKGLFLICLVALVFTLVTHYDVIHQKIATWEPHTSAFFEPQDRKTHGFGTYNHNLSFNGDARHYGNDYRLPENTPILAPTHGTVTRTFDNDLGGHVLEIREDNGQYFQWFMHLNAFKVKVGDTVKPGDVIALSGNTGQQTTGPHLHFQRMNGGVGNRFAEDPDPFVEQLPKQQRSLYQLA